MRRLIALGLVCGCAQVDRRPLADLHATDVHVYASDDNVRVGVGANFIVQLATPDCAALEQDAVATIAGVPFHLSDGTPGTGPGHCVGPSTEQTPLPAGTFTGAPVSLVIADHTETWTIDLPGIWDGDVALASPVTPGATTTVRWNDGPAVYAACFQLDDPTAFITCTPHADITVQDNTALVAIPASTPAGPAHATVELDGEFAPGTTSCVGPASCGVDLVVTARYPVTL